MNPKFEQALNHTVTRAKLEALAAFETKANQNHDQ
jgi:hypothetical protein